MIVASTEDFREAARRRLPHFLFEYIDGGAYAERTLRRNRSDLSDIDLRQRVLRDVSTIDTSTQLLGTRTTLPIALGPVGLAGMNARRGEVQAARSARNAGIPFTLSTVSVCTIEEVAERAGPGFWFQLYVIRDRGFLRSLLDRAWSAGCRILILTVDMPVPGARYRDKRSGLSGATSARAALRRFAQAAMRPAWAYDVGLRGRPHHLGNVASVLGDDSGLEDFLAWMSDNFDPSVTWSDLERLRAIWGGKLIIKGILDLEDARQASAIGADAIIVSNHGGRQLDGVPSTARALPQIAESIGDRLTVLADGGVRSGLDVLRMLGLGARGVLLGRAWAYALGAGGETGVTKLLTLIEAELRAAMSLTGVTSIDQIDRSILTNSVPLPAKE